MEQINWRISPAATLAKYLFTTQTERSVLPPEWQSVMPRIAENASKLGISAAAFSSSSRFVDALEPLITSNRLPQLLAGIAEPITEQITNEVSLRTSQLKHHWLVRGPGFLELLEQYCPLFNFVVLDLWTTIPVKQGDRATAPMLLGENYHAALFTASLHDSNPYIPEVMRPAYVATYFAIKAQLPRDLDASNLQHHLSLASCRLTLSLGNEVELSSVDKASFETAVELWMGVPAPLLVEEVWEMSREIHQLSDLTDFCLSWIVQANPGETR